jgi:hypothetical protein
VARSGQRDVGEVDAVVRFVGQQGRTGFMVGSMKTHVSGDSDIRKLAKQVRDHYAQRMPIGGYTIQLAFMAETMRPSQLDRVKATCKRMGVRLYKRNGRSSSRVEL